MAWTLSTVRFPPLFAPNPTAASVAHAVLMSKAYNTVGSTFNGRPGRQRQRRQPTSSPPATSRRRTQKRTLLTGYHVGRDVFHEKPNRLGTGAASGPVDR
ncbi:hypothetical protein [Dictyobacter halimunensis]|uniref:hypothetical protein n=1 Tax=Dictyobacter halimunensis TaxID=3026934 RepID=UPI0030C66BA1